MQGLSLGGFGRNGAWGSTVLKLGSMWLEASHDFPCSHWSPATAPQQEADAEANQETGNKTSQGSSSNTQSAPSEPASTPKEKETSSSSSNSSSTEKSKDSNSVRVSLVPKTLSVLPPFDVPCCLCLSGWRVVPYGHSPPLHFRTWRARAVCIWDVCSSKFRKVFLLRR